MDRIAQNVVEAAMSYAAYRELIDRLFVDGKTTGNDHRKSMVDYTRLNISRMRRLDKTTRLTEDTLDQLERIQTPMIWLVLTEGWCGDAAQIIPVLNHMAHHSENVELKFLLRDQHLDIMDAFLTNGGRSIPKVIFLEAENLRVLGEWGPRPFEMQKKVLDAKTHSITIADETDRQVFNDDVKKEVQLWYANDKTRSIQREFLAALFEHLVIT